MKSTSLDRDSEQLSNDTALFNAIRRDQNIPDNVYLGHAVDNGDCFYDAVVQSLKQLRPDKVPTIKSLRLMCKTFMQSNLSNVQSWFKEQYDSNQKLLNDDIPRIEFTAEEIKDDSNPAIKLLRITTPIWGRPEIEGRIICQEYDVTLHILEQHTVDGKKLYVNQIIDKTGSKTQTIDYRSNNIIHIVNNGKEHFAPLLDKSKTLQQSHEVKMQGVPVPTEGDGDCFFHAAFGENMYSKYRAPNACHMRQEWYNFLSKFKSLQDPAMPIALKEQLKKIFNLFLNDTGDLTGRSEAIKALADETKHKINDADTKVQKLKDDIANKFQNDVDFQYKIYPIIQKAKNKENKLPPTIQELLHDKDRLVIEISNDLEKCALESIPNLSTEQYQKQYNPRIITNSFLENPDVYSNYLAAIKNSTYYVFFEEIPIIVSLANIEITVRYNEGRSEIFKPNQELVGSYKSDSSIWGTISKVVISHEGMHFSHVNPDQQEGINRQSNGNNETIITKSTITNIQAYTFESSTKEKSNTRKSSNDTINVVASIKQDDVSDDHNNEYYFPRCEYNARFQGTSAFMMSEPKYWNTYFRSTSPGGNCDRISNLVKSDKTYKNSNINKSSGDNNNIPPAKSGCIKSPWVHDKYKEIFYSQPFSPKEVNKNNAACLYDQLLQYKLSICSIVVSSFVALSIPDRKINVYCENDYPCVMVQVPQFQVGGKTSSLYSIVTAYFTAITNYTAQHLNVPIELVNRASFGHNIPSVAETKTSFRINIGIIPKIYAETVLVKALELLNTNFLVPLLNKSPKFGLQMNQEELQKHNKAIEEYNLTKQEKAKKNKPATVALWGATDALFDVLCKVGDSSNKKVSFQIVRKNQYIDLLTDYVNEEIKDGKDLAKPLRKLLKKLDYSSIKTTCDVKDTEFKTTLTSFCDEEENQEIAKDTQFWEIISNINLVFNIQGLFNVIQNKKIINLYSMLEKANLEFIRNVGGQQADEDGYGSDSDCEFSIQDNDKYYYSKKIIVSTGMRAINLAHFLSIYLTNLTEFDVEYMYYETRNAIKLVSNVLQSLKLARSNSEQKQIRYIDLTHCADKGPNSKVQLSAKSKEQVIILDYTSATSKKISEAIRLLIHKVPVLLLVSSGLKNEQIGADMNPYGSIRIITQKENTLNELYFGLKAALADKEVLPKELHNIRKAYKAVGAVVTSAGIYKKNGYDDYKPKNSMAEDYSVGGFKFPDQFKKIFDLFYKNMYRDELYNLTETHNQDINEIVSWSMEKIEFLGSDDVMEVVGKFDEDSFEQIEDLYDRNEELARNIVQEILTSKEDLTNIDFAYLEQEYVEFPNKIDRSNFFNIFNPHYEEYYGQSCTIIDSIIRVKNKHDSESDEDRMSLDEYRSNSSSLNDDNSNSGSDDDSSSAGSLNDDTSVSSLGDEGMDCE